MGRHLMVAGFEFVVPFAQLCLNLLGHQINGGVQIALRISCDQILAGKRQLHCAGIFLLRHSLVVTLQINEYLQRVGFLMIQFLDAQADVFPEAIGKSDLVGRQDQFHTTTR